MEIKIVYPILCQGETHTSNSFDVLQRVCDAELWDFEQQGDSKVVHATKFFSDVEQAKFSRNAFIARLHAVKTKYMGIRAPLITGVF